MMSSQAEKCCHLASKHEASAGACLIYCSTDIDMISGFLGFIIVKQYTQ